MDIEWLSDDETEIERQEWEVYEVLQGISIAERLDEGLQIIYFN